MPKIIEYFQRSWLHPLARDPVNGSVAYIDDSKGHAAAGKVARQRKDPVGPAPK